MNGCHRGGQNRLARGLWLLTGWLRGLQLYRLGLLLRPAWRRSQQKRGAQDAYRKPWRALPEGAPSACSFMDLKRVHSPL
jgi:hypothetical protein